MTFDLELSSRRALVTAGTKGAGVAVVEVLSENGAKVVTTARSITRRSAGSFFTPPLRDQAWRGCL